MNYPKELDVILKRELTELINMKKSKIPPFTKETIRKYHEIYENIKKV